MSKLIDTCPRCGEPLRDYDDLKRAAAGVPCWACQRVEAAVRSRPTGPWIAGVPPVGTLALCLCQFQDEEPIYHVTECSSTPAPCRMYAIIQTRAR